MNALLGTGLAASTAQGVGANGTGIEPPNSSPQSRKLMKECRQFEGILIANLWKEMQKGMNIEDTGNDPGSGTMLGFGIQAAAMGIASAGGLGIARMLYHELAPRLKSGRASQSGAAAGLLPNQ